MRVTILTQWFDPEPTLKGLRFATALRDRGIDVVVVTGFPNYPGGRLYDGHKLKLFRKEKVEGITINRVPLYPSHSGSKIGRVLNYLSFAISSLFYLLFSSRKSDLLYVYHPPVTVALVGLIVKKVRKIPFVLDVQDLWPDTLMATGMAREGVLLRLVSKACDVVYREAQFVSVISRGFKKKLIERGVEKEKIEIIYNWANEFDRNISTTINSHDNQNFKLLYAGNMGKAQELENVLFAASLLSGENNVEIDFLGDGVCLKDLQRRANEIGLSNVAFLPKVTPSEVAPYLLNADALLVHLQDAPLFSITIPSKTQVYMYAGKPILMAVRGDASTIVTEANCGLVVEPGNPEALAEGIRNLREIGRGERKRMGLSGRKYYDENMSFDRGVEKFERIFKLVYSAK